MEDRLGRNEFAKYHALGNDYIVVDPKQLAFALTPARIRAICNRHTGVGSDGILALTAARRADFGMRIYNPDGSEAEKSGNGVRIFARALYDLGYTSRRSLSLATKGGVVRAELSLRQGRVQRLRVAMGRASFASRDIPVRGRTREVLNEELRVRGRRWRVTCVSLGNPHCVIFVPQLRLADLRSFGPLIERHPRFPRRINVQFAHIQSRRAIEALIWERGAGETMASGSSSCAIVAAAFKRGYVEPRVTVRMPGGQLTIEVGPDFALHMTGPATPVYRGRLM